MRRKQKPERKRNQNPARLFVLVVAMLLLAEIGWGLGLALGPQDETATFGWSLGVNGVTVIASFILMTDEIEEWLDFGAPDLEFAKIASVAVATGGLCFGIGLSIANAPGIDLPGV